MNQKLYLNIIQAAISRKKSINKRYTNSMLAKKLDVSNAFLSAILNGKKEIPSSLLNKLFEFLSIDQYGQHEILKGIVADKYHESMFLNIIEKLNISGAKQFLPLLDIKTQIIKKWYYLAILEHLSCDDFVEDPNVIAKKFNITPEEVTEGLLVLENCRAISRNASGKLIKNDAFLRVPVEKSEKEIREFHLQMLDKAKAQLIEKHDNQDHSKRLISGITLSVNENNIEKCKVLLEEAIQEISIKLGDGECRRVYQLNIQLFPLDNEINQIG